MSISLTKPTVGSTGWGTAVNQNWTDIENVINTSVREKLTAARTYYVATTGSDSNDGLSVGSPFLTIQKAVDVASALDNGGFDITIQLANGTYSSGVTLKTFFGSGKIIVKGDETTPANVVVSTTTSHGFVADGVLGVYSIRGIKTTSTTSGDGLNVTNSTIEFQNLEFGSVPTGGSYHIKCMKHALVTATGNYKVSGSAYRHVYCFDATLEVGQRTITFSNSPAFGVNIECLNLGYVSIWGMTFTNGGTVTGTRYSVTGNGVIFTNSGGANYIPGNAGGSSGTGGQYL